MRVILTILAVAVVILIGAYAIDVDMSGEFELPDVDVAYEEGELPETEVNTMDIETGTAEADVTYPEVDVEMEEGEVTYPTVDIESAEDGDSNAY